MAEIVIKTIRLKRGTSEAWTRVNPVLLEGEPGFEKDTNKLKIGNGTSKWTELPYFNQEFSIAPDGKSITYSDSAIELYGYSTAGEGQIPSKGKDHIEWIDPAQAISLEEVSNICIIGKE